MTSMIITLKTGREGRGVCELLFNFSKVKIELTGAHMNNFLQMQKTK